MLDELSDGTILLNRSDGSVTFCSPAPRQSRPAAAEGLTTHQDDLACGPRPRNGEQGGSRKKVSSSRGDDELD